MLYNLWRFIQLLLPYGLILHIYRCNKAMPANIKTRTGRNFRAILITTEYGIIFSDEKYIQNRTKRLKEKQKQVEAMNNALIDEINSLSFAERERLYGLTSEE